MMKSISNMILRLELNFYENRQRYNRRLFQTTDYRLLGQPDQRTYAGFRDYVLMLLFVDTGIRCSESLRLKKDFDYGRYGRRRVMQSPKKFDAPPTPICL
jgi:site-specific recombinase XerD